MTAQAVAGASRLFLRLEDLALLVLATWAIFPTKLVLASVFLGLAATWAAHSGFDRVLGYELKYATAFSDTHLGRVGRNHAGS